MKILIIPLLLITSLLFAQHDTTYSKPQVNIGLGAGLDYGGFGIRATVKPINRFGLFGAGGYNLDGVGFNLGAQYYFNLGSQSFYLTGMYGYNGVIIVTGDIEDKATYYGVSAGLGYQFVFKHARGSTIHFELLLPFRSQAFEDDLDTLKALGAEVRDALPIAISIGYHIRL